MKFFRKLKEKLFSTSSKLNNGLEEIVDKQKDEIFNQHNNETEDSNNHISLNIKEDLRKQKKAIETTSTYFYPPPRALSYFNLIFILR